MPVTNYYTANGQIIGEKTTGQTRIDYLTDALGSVTATVNQSAQIVNSYRYKPYGVQLSKTGTGVDPAFGWAGAQGYRATEKAYSDTYVRARHYSSEIGRWSTVDPLGFVDGINLYGYVQANPISLIDFSGLSICGRGARRLTINCKFSNTINRGSKVIATRKSSTLVPYNTCVNCVEPTPMCDSHVTQSTSVKGTVGRTRAFPGTVHMGDSSCAGAEAIFLGTAISALNVALTSPIATLVNSVVGGPTNLPIPGVPKRSGVYVDCQVQSEEWYNIFTCKDPSPPPSSYSPFCPPIPYIWVYHR